MPIFPKRTPFESTKITNFWTLAHSIDLDSADANFEFQKANSNSSKVIANWICTSSIERSSYAGNTYPEHEQFWLDFKKLPSPTCHRPIKLNAVIPG
jgi:hypothetical protein